MRGYSRSKAFQKRLFSITIKVRHGRPNIIYSEGGVCGNHSEARTMDEKVLRAGYFWLTVQSDCDNYVKKCIKCQEHDILSHLKPETLHTVMSPWPFAVWEIEAEPLASILAMNVQNFV